jgi:hypothetical protein
VAAALSLTAAALVVPAALGSAPPVLCALASMSVVVLAGLLGRLRGRAPSNALVAVAGAAAAAGVALAVVSSRV